MTCIIDSIILYLSKKGETAKGIKDYLKNKYRITIDSASIKQRLKNMGGTPNLT